MKTTKKYSLLDQQLEDYTQRACARKSRGTRSGAKKHWLTYTAAAGAAVAGPAAANAAIVSSGPQMVQLSNTGTNGNSNVGIDLDNDGNDDFSLFLQRYRYTYFTGDFTYNTNYSHIDNTAALGPAAGGNEVLVRDFSILKKLSLGSPISSGAGDFGSGDLARSFEYVHKEVRSLISSTPSFVFHTESTTESHTEGDFTDSNSGFAGVKFKIGGNNHFGWIKLHVAEDATGPYQITALGWAYESIPDLAIAAGAEGIPEPTAGGLALLAAGAVGLGALRNKRREAGQNR